MEYRKCKLGDIDLLIKLWKVLMQEHKKIEPMLYNLLETAEKISKKIF